jgi:hypothetical protein
MKKSTKIIIIGIIIIIALYIFFSGFVISHNPYGDFCNSDEDCKCIAPANTADWCGFEGSGWFCIENKCRSLTARAVCKNDVDCYYNQGDITGCIAKGAIPERMININETIVCRCIDYQCKIAE